MSQKSCCRDIFEALNELSGIMPEMRAGQLMAAVGEVCADMHGHGLWDATNDEIYQALQRFRSNFEVVVMDQSPVVSEPK